MTPQEELARTGGGTVAQAGATADAVVGRLAWNEYLEKSAPNTLRAQRNDLECFAAFLKSIGVVDAPAGDALQGGAAAWAGVTPGLLLAFREWMMTQGYAVATVNRRLTTAKVYARKAGIDPQGAKVFGHKAGRNRDQKRAEAGTKTRVGAKKAYKAVTLTYAGAQALLKRPETPQGRRDAVLTALLLEHGLRCGEVALLTVSDFDLSAGTMTFYRPKVDKVQTHRLTPVSLKALKAYQAAGEMPTAGAILRSSRKGGALTHEGMTERSITARVRDLGKEIGIHNLSAHDCRHYWATRASERGTHPKHLQQAGGWNSPAMVMRYVNETAIANEGVIL